MISLGTWSMGEPVEVFGVRVVRYTNASGQDWYQSVAWAEDKTSNVYRKTSLLIEDRKRPTSLGLFHSELSVQHLA